LLKYEIFSEISYNKSNDIQRKHNLIDHYITDRRFEIYAFRHWRVWQRVIATCVEDHRLNLRNAHNKRRLST